MTNDDDRVAHPEPLLHIGYAKTGSTWMQLHLFDESSGVFRPLAVHPNIPRRVAMPDPWDYDRDEARSYVASVLETWGDDAIPVVSWEHLVGIPHSRGFEGPVYRDRLVDLFPGGRYLIVIREQVSTLSSRYEQYIWGSGDASVREYLRARGKPHSGRFNPTFLQYHRLIEGYHEVVGADRVLVLPFELMVADAPEFVDRIAVFAGASDDARERLRQNLPFGQRENAGRGRTATALVRLGQKASYRSAGLLKRLGAPPIDRDRIKHVARRVAPHVPSAVESALDRSQMRRMHAFDDLFRASNRRTQELTGLDLEAWGYLT